MAAPATTATPAPHEVMETWEITTPGRVWVQTTTYSRHNQPVIKDVSLGPNKVGQKVKITAADREMNQERVADVKHDPFRNGLLVRVDADQNTDPDTASTDALTAQQLMDIFAKHGSPFRAAVDALGEVPIRRLREMADAVDATVKQVSYLDEVIDERYRIAASQPDAIFDLSGERREDLEQRQR
jgi:hypothetical protein